VITPSEILVNVYCIKSTFTIGLQYCSAHEAIGLHSIGYMGDGFYRSKDPTNSIKVLKEQAYATFATYVIQVLHNYCGCRKLSWLTSHSPPLEITF